MANIRLTEGTQTSVYTENAGTVEVGAVKIDISAAGTYGVSMFRGTIARVHDLGTLPNLPAGTLTLLTRLGNLGTLEAGTISALPNIPGGTIGEVTSVANLAGGTVTRLLQGSVNVTAGTVNAGTINLGTMVGKDANAAAQTGNPLGVGGTDSGGTIRTWGVDANGIGRVKFDTGTISTLPNIPGGTLGLVSELTNLAGGTVTRLLDGSVRIPAGTINLLAAGTVTRLEQGSINVTAGTVNAGTINAGTIRINPNPTVHTQPFGTASAATIGTIVAAPSAGSAILLHSVDVSVVSGTPEWLVSYGLAVNGNGVVTRGLSAAGGGISKNPTYPIGGSVTGSALTWNILSGSGTLAISIAYQIAVP